MPFCSQDEEKSDNFELKSFKIKQLDVKQTTESRFVTKVMKIINKKKLLAVF